MPNFVKGLGNNKKEPYIPIHITNNVKIYFKAYNMTTKNLLWSFATTYFSKK
jgi:hypothetical protein